VWVSRRMEASAACRGGDRNGGERLSTIPCDEAADVGHREQPDDLVAGENERLVERSLPHVLDCVEQWLVLVDVSLTAW
jgi:hypothetical protein